MKYIDITSKYNHLVTELQEFSIRWTNEKMLIKQQRQKSWSVDIWNFSSKCCSSQVFYVSLVNYKIEYV